MTFSAYGLILGLAFILAAWLAEQVLVARRPGAAGQRALSWLPLWVFTGGVLGARLYHVFTDWSLYQSQPLTALFIWRGGLGIFGGVLGGLAAVALWKRFFQLSWSWGELTDAAAIALPFGQALGRWGNFLNQELYGPPTNLPWGIYIDPAHRLPGYETIERYHPLFLYESLMNLGLGLVLYTLWRISRRTKDVSFLQPGSGLYLGFYLIAYGTVRFSLEFLRLSSAGGPLGVTVAQWFAIGFVAAGLILLARASRQGMATLALVGTLLFALGLPASVSAQQTAPFDLSLSPSVVEVAVQPGKLVTQAFLLENGGTTDLEVTPVLRDFSSDGRTGQAVLLETNTFPFARLQNAEVGLDQPFLLPANSSQQIVLGLDIPEEASERDWYFSLLFLTRRAEGVSLTDSGAQARGALGANLLVRVTDSNLIPLIWKLSLFQPKIIDSLQTLNVRVLAENASATVAAPELSMVILNWKGEIVYEQEGLPDRVLAGSTREILAGRPRKDDPRSFEPIPFAYDPLFALGPYRIRATIRNAQDGPVVVEEEVLALPISLILAGGLLASGLFALHHRHRLAETFGQGSQYQHRRNPQRSEHHHPDNG